MRFINFPFKLLLNNHLINYPTPTNLNYFWGFGSVSGLCLVIQVITGICLAMHYSAHTTLAFSSVEHIMRDVNNGWLLRYIHANGASMFFIGVYTHIGRGLYYKSYLYPKASLWISGITLFTLMMATAFMGYVLPWGQMSFWGATVITNLFSAIPIVGQDISYWLWGGYSVGNATLNRFYSLHYLLPFLIVGIVLAHLSLLHIDGSNNPLGLKSIRDKISFYPYFYIKDLFGLLLFWSFFAFFVFYKSNLLGHPDNYIKANPLITPPHIVPEWYFLPFYAILRSVPNKLGGIVCMGCAIAVLGLLPLLGKSLILNPRFNPLYKAITFFFIFNIILLGWLGGMPAGVPFVLISQICTLFYFSYFFILLPLLNVLEKKILICAA